MKRKQMISMIVTLALAMSVLGKCPVPVIKETLAAEEISIEVNEQRLVPDENCWEYQPDEDDSNAIFVTGFMDGGDYSWDDRENDEKNGITYCLVVPAEIAGKKVTNIKLNNYYMNTNRKITSIDIPSTVSSIAEDAFWKLTSLTHITIPDGVTEIGDSAFSGCEALSSVELPDSLTSINAQAFYGCWSLEEVVIPSNVSHIAETAFADCRGMKKFIVQANNEGGYYAEDGILYKKWMDEVPVYGDEKDEDGDPIVDYYKEVEKKTLLSYPGAKKGVCNLDANMDFSWTAFLNVKGLTAINVDSENPDYTSVDGVIYKKNMKELCVCPAGKSGEYTVPDGVYSIQTNSFSNSALMAIHFPDSLGAMYEDEEGWKETGFIGEFSLYQCDDLQTITLGRNITEELLSILLKYNNPKLENISISEDNSELSTIDNVVYDKEVKKLVYVPVGIQGRLILPDTVETTSRRIGGDGITELVLGANYAVTIKEYYEDDDDDTFSYQYVKGVPKFGSLKSIEVSPLNQTLAAYDGLLYSKDLGILYYCPDAKEGVVTIPEGTTKIIGDVFNQHTEDKSGTIQEIIIPGSVTEIQCGGDDIDYSAITIKCPAGSEAEKFAQRQGAQIVITPSDNPATQEPSVTATPVPTDSVPTDSPMGTEIPAPFDTPTSAPSYIESGDASPTPSGTQSSQDSVTQPSQGTSTVSPVATKRPTISRSTPTPYTPPTFKIKVPGKVKLKKARALGNRKVKLNWKWSSVYDGYQLQYAMNRSFTKNRKTQNKSDMAETATIKNLKKGKTYYFRVRAYRETYFGGKKYGKWGKWGNIKKVKVR